MSTTYEIEIKVLLGSESEKDRLFTALHAGEHSPIFKGKNSQLNHYFIGGDLMKLESAIVDRIPEDKKVSFHHVATEGKKHSVRTRYVDGKTILVIKASIDDTSSSNGIARIEWEMDFLSTHIDTVDAILLGSGFEYQAKWSRDREEYDYGEMVVCIDRNAGYGYVAEFERVVDDSSNADAIKQELRSLIESLGFSELSQGRLERMFAYYNENWRQYYGTDKVFTLE